MRKMTSRSVAALCLLVAGLCVARPAAAQSDYYRHVSSTTASSSSSTGRAARRRRRRANSSRSAIACRWNPRCSARHPTPCASSGNRRPAAAGMRRSSSSVSRIDIRTVPAETLYFWVYSPEPIAAADLPGRDAVGCAGGLQVATMPGSFTVEEPLADYTGDLPAGQWVPVRIPLAKLRSASVYQFHPERLQSIIFHQRRADGKKHVLIVDDIRVDDEPAAGAAPTSLPVPDGVSAKGYDRHIDVQWRAPARKRRELLRRVPLDRWRAVRARRHRNGRASIAMPISSADRASRRATSVAAADWEGRESGPSAVVTAATREMTRRRAARPCCRKRHSAITGKRPALASGMAHENLPGDDRIVATGATGLGISALVAAVHRKFITRDQGLERLEKIVSFLERAPRYHGAWSHYYNDDDGRDDAALRHVRQRRRHHRDVLHDPGAAHGARLFRPQGRARAVARASASPRSGMPWNGTGSA